MFLITEKDRELEQEVRNKMDIRSKIKLSGGGVYKSETETVIAGFTLTSAVGWEVYVSSASASFYYDNVEQAAEKIVSVLTEGD